MRKDPYVPTGREASIDVFIEAKKRKLTPSPDPPSLSTGKSSSHGLEKAPPFSRQGREAANSSNTRLKPRPDPPTSSSASSQCGDILTCDGAEDLPPIPPSTRRSTNTLALDTTVVERTRTAPSSSLSSLSRSTQSSGSKRKMVEDVVVLKDSSSDVDSEDSLVDITELIAKRRNPVNSIATTKSSGPLPRPPPLRKESDMLERTSKKRGSDRLASFGRLSKMPAVPSPPSNTKYKFSLDTIVKESEKSAAMEFKVIEIMDKLEEEEKEINSPVKKLTVDESYLASVVEHDEEDEGRAKRVAQAISRTEALEENLAWHFFNVAPTGTRKSFPCGAIPTEGWNVLLRYPQKRQLAFTTGFVKRMAADRQDSPTEMLDWLLSEICHERREDLLYAYVETLVASAGHLEATLTTGKIQELFETLGARREAVEAHGSVNPESSFYNASNRVPYQLQWLLRFLEGLAPSLSNEARSYIIQILTRLCLDDSVWRDGQIQLLIEQTLISLFDNISETELESTSNAISRTLFETIPSPILRNQLISALPRSSPRTHLFRRRLALAFALEKSQYIEKSMTNPNLTDHILLYLTKSPLFRISPSTNYRVLCARFTMLDIAIDAGFSDFSWLRGSAQTSEEREVEKRFNASVDMLAQEIREIMVRIVDAGITSLRRTEAKAAAQRLEQRLDCAVRTREKATRDWFSEGRDDVVRREFMEKWFRREGKEKVEEVGNVGSDTQT